MGIGTASPTRPLTVITGTTRHNLTGGVLFTSALSATTGGVLLGSDNNVGYIAGVDGLGTTVGSLVLNQNGGSVGIGTTPSEIFHVKASGSVVPTWESSSTTSPVYHKFLGADGLAKAYVGMDSSAGGGLIGAGSYAFSVTTASTNNLVLGTNSTIRATINGSTGAFNIVGALSKGSGTFDIAHPDPTMPKNARLRHSFVESPTAGDNIYRWQIKVTRENGKFFIKLPKYWTHLNTNPMVWVSSADQPAASFGYVDMKQEKVIVQADRVGTYNVLLLGTRKDSLATNNWKELGMEYISKGIGEAEKILSYNAQPEFGEEPQTLSNVKTIHELSQKAANEKKLLALEESNQKLIEDNKRLREMVETHGRASLRLEDRLRAIENTQMARK